ncbi:site-specific recombinase XerD [Caldimonas thermodepolymerans]|nr:site-specific recombinase XerD [Caldimonas thermodepolymerans]
MLFKRNGSPNWYYEFVYKGKRYRGATGTASKTEARAIVNRIRQQVAEDVAAKRQGIKRWTMGQLADAWLAASKNTHRDWKNNESRVRKLFGRALVDGKVVQATYKDDRGQVRPRFGLSRDLPVHELSHATLLELRNARALEGNSPATINREMALVQSLVAFAAANGVVTPAKPLVFSSKRQTAGALKFKESKGKLRWLTLEEETALLAELERKYEESKGGGKIGNVLIQDQIDLCIFLLDTGARYNEVARLTRDVLDMERGVVNLYRSKFGKASDLKMTARLRRMLEARLQRLGTRRYLFPAGQGRNWADEDIPRGHATRGIQASIDAAGLNDPLKVQAMGRVTPHTFRDTFASRLIQNGFTLYEVQALLGHSSPAMTQKYAKLLVLDVSSRAAEKLNELHGQRAIRSDAETIPFRETPPVNDDPSAVTRVSLGSWSIPVALPSWGLGPPKSPPNEGPLINGITLGVTKEEAQEASIYAASRASGMVGCGGLEPSTNGLKVRCSTS